MRSDRAAKVPWPPGETGFSLARTRRFDQDPLGLLLESYERYGPIFTLKIFHHNAVFMLGPAANHYMLVSHAKNFLWREGHLRDLIPLLGDGLLTIDGAFHRTHRKLMLPAFHREQIAAATAVMQRRGRSCARELRAGRRSSTSTTGPGAWRCASRCARCSGSIPDTARAGGLNAAAEFESALSFYARDYLWQIPRGPYTPFWQLMRSRRRLDALVYGEIDRRRATGERGMDVLSLLLDAQDEDGNSLERRHVRDEVMTLLFAGHDTTTSTVSFMFYELARNPDLLDDPGVTVDMILDETLRKYPPAYIGPRRAVESFEFEGVTGSRRCARRVLLVGEPPPARRVARAARSSGPSASPRRTRRSCRWAPTCRSAAARGPASGCASARPRSRSSRARSSRGTGSSWCRATSCDIRHAPTISPRAGLPMRVHAAEPAAVLSAVPPIAA